VGWGEVKAQWTARPPTVRAWVALMLIAGALDVARRQGLSLAYALVLTALFTWGMWTGKLIVWVLAVVGVVTSIGFGTLSEPQLPSAAVGLLCLSLLLLLTPDTREWVHAPDLPGRPRSHSEPADRPGG
jgi:hypothetical protein